MTDITEIKVGDVTYRLEGGRWTRWECIDVAYRTLDYAVQVAARYEWVDVPELICGARADGVDLEGFRYATDEELGIVQSAIRSKFEEEEEK